MKNIISSLLLVGFMLMSVSCKKQESNNNVKKTVTQEGGHPNLILTKQSVSDIKSKLGSIPLFDITLEKAKKEVDTQLEKGIDVPIPKDMAGGYTHTQHKINYATMQKSGVLFQLLGDEKYAIYIRDMLLEYAKMFPTLPLHPQERSYARGKIFWQCLNDSNWLVFTSQAYDCIYDWLPKEQTDHLNKTLFRPYADFLSVETPQYFNRVHNHSTWGNVAVGMIALVMDDDELLDRALNGLDKKDVDLTAKDNDGGFIYDKEGKAGFLANLDSPFSPDGYYTEGPYYHRYAMYPFLIFAEALENKRPDLKIFEYKNGVLIKAVNTLLNLTDADGEFFPLNDGQKGMSYYTASLVSAVDIAYYYGTQDAQLLSVAKQQNKVQLDGTGLAVALALKEAKEEPFIKKSMEITDGSKGDEGGLGVLRFQDKEETLGVLFKYTAHGLSHGHFDKLSYSLYENGDEVLQDYGLSRFVNVEQKNGGGYLKENQTWAKQSIAHNTIVQNQVSHFSGKFSIGNEHHSDRYIFDVSDPDFQIVSAKEKNAYPGTELHRTIVMIKDKNITKPYLLDIYKINSTKSNQYDLPYYYFGQIVSTNFNYKTTNNVKPLGASHGYQHLFKEADGNLDNKGAQFTWLNNNRFYTLTSATENNDEVILGRIGANDPEYNLRRDPVIIQRKKNVSNTVFANIIESHGKYNAVTEKASNAYSNFEAIKVLFNSDAYTAIEIKGKEEKTKLFILSNLDSSRQKSHLLTINGNTYNWKGVYYFK